MNSDTKMWNMRSVYEGDFQYKTTWEVIKISVDYLLTDYKFRDISGISIFSLWEFYIKI